MSYADYVRLASEQTAPIEARVRSFCIRKRVFVCALLPRDVYAIYSKARVTELLNIYVDKGYCVKYKDMDTHTRVICD